MNKVLRIFNQKTIQMKTLQPFHSFSNKPQNFMLEIINNRTFIRDSLK